MAAPHPPADRDPRDSLRATDGSDNGARLLAPMDSTLPIRVDRQALRRWAVGVVLFGLVYGVALLALRRYNMQGFAESAAERAGLWGIAIFLGLMVTAVMSPLPDSPIALAGLVAYGPLGGLCLVVAGSWLGAMADFLLVRVLGRERFRRRFPRMAAPMDGLADRLGFELLVVLRFLPTVSFDIVSYAAAVTRIRFTHFAGATFLGQLPGPTIAALVGAGVGGADRRLTVALGLLAGGLLALLLVVRRMVRQRRRVHDGGATARDRRRG